VLPSLADGWGGYVMIHKFAAEFLARRIMARAGARHRQTGLPEMLGTRECQIAVLSWGNGYGWPAGPCYYARL